MAEAKPATSQSIKGVDRALDVLSLFGELEEPTLGVTEIANKLNLSKAVVYRILAALRAKGYAEMDPATHRYSLGPQLVVIGLRYLDRLDPHAVAREGMSRLSERTNETVTFSIRSGFSRTYIDQITPNRDIKMTVQIGRPFPLHTGASSKALLASMSVEEQETYLTSQTLEALTVNSITDPTQLRDELKKIREQGYALSFGERDEGAASVAAPVYEHTGKVVGVISVSGPLVRFRSEINEAAVALLETTRGISMQLGYREHH